MSQELGITCPEEHEALEEKYRVLQHKLRDRLEKLNLNLGEIAIMQERAEMAEQAREKIRFAMALLLDEFKQVLQDFDTCSEIDNEKRNKLEAIYQRMLNIQNDERKASEELINHEISDSKNCVSHVAEDVAERVRAEESNNVEDSLDYFDKKEEEHTLRQAERNNEVQNINKELALKESFVSELIKSATQETAESRKNIIEMEQESKRLHAEKEEHLQAVHAHNVSSKENMTSNYHSSHCENDVRYPYTDRVAVGEDYVDFIYQFVKDSNISTKDCKNAASISNIRNNIIGTPSNFPSHEDFLLETYNFDISISPWQKQVPYAAYAYVPKYLKDFYFDHIDLEFHEAVYPIRISIYEVYMKNNFGNVIEVWAQDSEDEDRWILLWNQSLFKFHEVCRLTERRRWGSRIFSPPLRSSNFKTKMLRLQFISNSCTQLDAVMLIGTSKLIFPKNPEDESITNLLHRIRKQRHSCSKRFCSSHSKDCSRIQQELYYTTHDYENAYLDIIDLQMEFSYYCIICKSDIATSFHKLAHKQVFREEDVSSSRQGYVNHPLLRNHWNYVKFIEDIKLSSGESKEQEDSFFALPDEIIRIILKYLDMRSFCRMSKVNKRFNNLTQDSSLFKCLNLRNLKKEYSKDSYFCYDKILSYFASKCTDLRQLDLTASCISEPDFVNFLQSCGHCLTHLRLSSCEFVGKLSLLKISEICKNLKVFDLSYCVALGKMDQEFSSLENLEFLENLDFGESDVKRTESLCKILQKTRRMRDLNLSSCYWDNFEPLHVDVITIQLKNSCPDLEIIDLSGNIITSRGIHALAECKNLRKLSMKNVNINEDCTIVKHSLHKLFSSCQCLEEVNLMDLDYRDGSSINENVYEGLTLCKNLRQLYLWDTDSFAILEQCPKLQTIYVRKWWKFDDHVHMRDDIAQAKEKYPHVSILEYQKGTSDAVDEEWLEM
ncbi:F-box/LRR-repeat protein 4-like [Temnothorax longispinosus]|uniref:F-box/LRR-repeat protein 4-like n=1 Tax=Temnothorax longispinosus TaxID=300112 RepID=UPI003A9A27D4